MALFIELLDISSRRNLYKKLSQKTHNANGLRKIEMHRVKKRCL
jgi:hypothetical protein